MTRNEIHNLGVKLRIMAAQDIIDQRNKPQPKEQRRMGLIIAIDPGISGAIAILDDQGKTELVRDLPIIRDGKLAWVDGSSLQSMILASRKGREARAIVERVQAMPGQGLSSSFNFGVGFGSILSVLQTLHLPIEFVTPAKWKGDLGLNREKRASLDKARLLYPLAELHLAKHDGRAEALLLAHWYIHHRQQKAAA